MTVDLRGTGVRADVVSGPVAAGPGVNYRFGRTADVKNAQVAAVPEGIDNAFVNPDLDIPKFLRDSWARLMAGKGD